MTIRIERSSLARTDLMQIWEFVAEDNADAADRLLHGINATVERLAEFPERGHRKDEIGLGVRLMLHKRYLIVYRYLPEEKLVSILRVVHGSRDLTRLLL